VAQPQPRTGRRECRTTPRAAGLRVETSARVQLQGEPRAPGRRPRGLVEHPLQPLQAGGLGGAELERQLRAAGDDVVGAGLELQAAEVHGATGEALADQLRGLDEETRGAEAGVAARVERRRAGVVGAADEDEVGGDHAADGLDDPDLRTRVRQARPLFDVQLEETGERGRLPPRSEDPGLGDPGPRHPALQRVAAAPRTGQLRGIECPRQGAAAQQPDEGALLVGEVDQLHVERGADSGVAQRAQHLVRGDHAERPVEATAVGHRVEVRAEQQRRGLGVGGGQAGPHVARAVEAGLEAVGGERGAEPRAGLEVRGPEGRPVDAPVPGRADRGQGVELAPHPCPVDAQIGPLPVSIHGRSPARFCHEPDSR